ncbi:MAG: cobalt ECF transporter T component CbiQ [Anaerolineae bacterium]|nr:cobalt ECF transporter T component CbiQ [Anaerolineae bacterium]
MYTNTFDRYIRQESLIHWLDPRLKVVTVVIFILATVLLPDGAWLGFALSWLVVLAFTWLARLPYGLVFKRSLVIIPFLLAALTVLFNVPGTAVFTWQIGPLTLTITDAGLVRFVSILIRGWLAVQMAILLTAVTPFPDLMHALTHLRVPAILVSIISFMYRYLFVLAEEAQRLMRARQARSARLPGAGVHGGSLFWRAKVTGHMVGQLFSRSLERSDRVYNAMLARGYHGRILTMTPHAMTRFDWLAGGTAVLFVVLIQLIARMSLSVISNP